MADEKKTERSLAAARGVTPPKKSAVPNVARATAPAPSTAVVRPTEIEDVIEAPVALRLAFVGAGQGGGRMAQTFWDIGYRRVGVYNTTTTDFAGIEGPALLSTDAGGAAKDPSKARNALRGREQQLADFLTRSWGTKIDCALVCVGLGGGTGSGSALAMVTAAREHLTKHGHKARVGAIVSLPSLSEGRQVAANAVNAFGELVLAGVSPLIVIDNDKIDKIYKPSMRQLLPKANEIASSLLHLLNTLSAVRSPYVSFDRAELEQLLDGGIMVVGSSDIPVDQLKSPVDVSEAVREQLLDGVLADVDLSTGKVAACLFVAATEVLDQFSSDYFNSGFTYFESVMGGENVVVHRGIYDESAEGLQCYSAVSGLAPPKDKLAALTKLAGSALGGSTASHLKVD